MHQAAPCRVSTQRLGMTFESVKHTFIIKVMARPAARHGRDLIQGSQSAVTVFSSAPRVQFQHLWMHDAHQFDSSLSMRAGADHLHDPLWT
jgi:hypothetical protein